MKKFKTIAIIAVFTFIVSGFTACMSPYYTSDEQVVYDNPDWAPPYYSGVRYYYIPDIEVYYDLGERVFIYLDNGYWRYSRMLPGMYAGFNLRDCYSIALNVRVYEPWRHHQYYVSNYPRYYYRDYYDRSNIPYVRGYNENTRSAFFWRNNERSRARDWNDESIRNGREFKYSKEDKARQVQPTQPTRSSRSAGNSNSNVNRQQDNRNGNGNATNSRPSGNVNDRSITPNRSSRSGNNTIERNNATDRSNVGGASETNRSNSNNRSNNNDRSGSVNRSNENQNRQNNASEAVKDSQRTNYYGRQIGQPVKVERQMRKEEQKVTRSESNNSSRSSRSSVSNSSRSNSETKSSESKTSTESGRTQVKRR